MRALGYAWQIVTNAFYFFVVWFVLDQLRERPESVIVPILGMLYITSRSTATSQAFGDIATAEAIDTLNERLKGIADPAYRREPEEIALNAKTKNVAFIKLYIALAFQALIGLLCIWKFFAALSAVNF